MDERFTRCPFNPEHRMLKLRLQKHILKCQKNYVNAGMKPCPYNATHIIANDDYRSHLQTCPDFRLIEGHRYQADDGVHGKLDNGAFHFNVNNDKEWETDSNPSDELLDDCNEVDDLHSEFDETEEPLQRYIFEEKKLQRLEESQQSPGAQKAADSEGEDQHLQQCGRGRGNIFRILTALKKK